MSHRRGTARYSASTLSVGMVVCEKSYSRLLVSTWIAVIGRNGRKTLAPSTLNMLPKLELAPILIYLVMLPKTLRPSITPSPSTARLFSSNMMSAESLAMSTALSTDMPTSAAFSAGPSLMPSPRNPTTCPFRCRASMIAAFCDGETLANTAAVSARLANSSGDKFAISLPRTMRSTARPTSWQILRVTISLSPVRIFTSTPLAFSAPSRGGAGLLRRIEKRDVAEQGEVGLVGDRIRRLRRRHLLEGDRDDPKPVRVELRRRIHRRGKVAVIKGPGLVVDRVVLASREYLFDGALADEDMNPVIAPENDGHPPPLEVERHLVNLLESGLHLEAGLELDMLQDRDVEQVLEARLVEAIQIGVFEDAVGLVASDIKAALENDAILRERAGLVRAQHVHGPEVLD